MILSFFTGQQYFENSNCPSTAGRTLHTSRYAFDSSSSQGRKSQA